MCSHYQAVREAARLRRRFGVEPPASFGKDDIWPGYEGLMIRRPPERDCGDEAVPDREALSGRFGLIPHWAKDTKIGRQTFNARSETVAEKPSFRDAWRRGQRCIIPAESFFEPDWRSGRAVPTRISRSDGEPMGIAGLWASWKAPEGEQLYSYTMMTINAEEHPLMRNFHKQGAEKRMPAILLDELYDAWLQAPVASSMQFLVQFQDLRQS